MLNNNFEPFMLDCFDPGVTTGYARFVVLDKENIQLVNFGVFSVQDLWMNVNNIICTNSKVLIEKFVNPHSKLTKEAIQTIELVGVLQYMSFWKAKEEAIIQIQAQKEGYMQFAKKWLEAKCKERNNPFWGDSSKRHAADAIAHGIRWLTKNVNELLPTKLAKEFNI